MLTTQHKRFYCNQCECRTCRQLMLMHRKCITFVPTVNWALMMGWLKISYNKLRLWNLSMKNPKRSSQDGPVWTRNEIVCPVILEGISIRACFVIWTKGYDLGWFGNKWKWVLLQLEFLSFFFNEECLIVSFKNPIHTCCLTYMFSVTSFLLLVST